MTEGQAADLQDQGLGEGIYDTILFNLGDITNNPATTTNNTITLLVTTLVSKDPLTNNNDILTTTATLTYTNGTQLLSTSDNFAVKVVEPSLAMTNVPTTTYTSHIGSGTVVKFTLTLSNVLPTSTGPSYNIDIFDGLSAHLVLVVGSVRTSSGTVLSGNNAGDKVVRVYPNALLPTSTVVVTFNATLQDTVEPSIAYPNTATYNYSSALLQTYNAFDIRNQTGIATCSITPTNPLVSFVLNYTTIPDTPNPYVAIGESASIVTTVSIPKVYLSSLPCFVFCFFAFSSFLSNVG